MNDYFRCAKITVLQIVTETYQQLNYFQTQVTISFK